MILTAERIAEGEMAPKGYFPSYYDWSYDCRVLYPFPINLIVRWARQAWFSINAINPERLKEPPAYSMGYNVGFSDGMERMKRWAPTTRQAQGCALNET